MSSLKYYFNLFSFSFLSCFSPNSFATAKHITDEWLSQQTRFAYQKIIENFSPNDGLKGSLVASTSKHNPNYHYHWVRDAGIVIDALILYYQNDATSDEQQTIRNVLRHHITFSKRIQNAPSITGLGEPKFYVDGTPFNEPWARPQNDGPALRAISLIQWANILIKEGKIQTVKKLLYSAELPATSPIKKDLEYIAHRYKEFTFDLWEEVNGIHFYTFMVERRALLLGAALANKLEDHPAAQYYVTQAKEIEKAIQSFWDEDKGYFVATKNYQNGADYKITNLDCAVILGLLHGDMNDGFIAWNDPRVIKTINHLLDTFKKGYPINQRADIKGIAIGRYPEDKYSGTDFNGGNPWVLCTLAIAEALYRYAHVLENNNEAKKHAITLADELVARVKFHAHQDGSLSEQINQYTGFMTSAENLTWNYAALITTRYAKF